MSTVCYYLPHSTEAGAGHEQTQDVPVPEGDG